MAGPRLRYGLTPSQREDIALACKIGVARLQRLADRIDDNFTIKRSKIEDTIQTELGPKDGAVLASLLLGIAATFRRMVTSADEVLASFTLALGNPPYSDPNLAKWEECRPALARLLTTRSITLAAKAWDIAYDFERVYVTGRVLTSIRPVFNEDREGHRRVCDSADPTS